MQTGRLARRRLTVAGASEARARYSLSFGTRALSLFSATSRAQVFAYGSKQVLGASVLQALCVVATLRPSRSGYGSRSSDRVRRFRDVRGAYKSTDGLRFLEA